MQHDPRYDDVVDDVKAFLGGVASEFAEREGRGGADLARSGHRLRQDARAQPRAAARLDEIVALGMPIVIGTSRKSSVIAPDRGLAGLAGPEGRNLVGTCCGRTCWRSERGSQVFRVHDVAPVLAALRVAAAALARRCDGEELWDDADELEGDGIETEESAHTAGVGDRRDHRSVAVHPSRRHRGRARGRPAARARHPDRGRRVRRDGDRPDRGHDRLRGEVCEAVALTAQQRSHHTLGACSAAPSLENRLLIPGTSRWRGCGSRRPSPSRRSRCPSTRCRSRSGARPRGRLRR